MMTEQYIISYQDTLDARERLRGQASITPVIESRTLNDLTGRHLFLKCELFQRGGAFKFRGAFNCIAQLSEEARLRGVVAFSSGNHAQGVALAARQLGAPAIICMPSDTAPVKVAATKGYGAEVVFFDRFTEDREAFARQIAEQRGMSVVPPFDHPHIMAGAGTTALEFLEQVPDLDALLVPIGGGGLISGSSIAAHGVHPTLRVVGVEPQGADDTLRSLRAGEPVSIPPPTTIADGLRVNTPGRLTFPIIQHHVEDVVVVSDDQIRAAVRFALLRLKLVIEPSGAVSLAAALAGKLPQNVQRIGLIISGGNIDPALLADIVMPAPIDTGEIQ